MNAREENIGIVAVMLAQHSSTAGEQTFHSRPSFTFARDAGKLQSIARQLHRLDELACNKGELAPNGELRLLRLENSATMVVQRYGLQVYHQTDPRGWPLYLFDPTMLNGHNIEEVYLQGLAICPR